jgi:hypothetical protein
VKERKKDNIERDESRGSRWWLAEGGRGRSAKIRIGIKDDQNKQARGLSENDIRACDIINVWGHHRLSLFVMTGTYSIVLN